MQVVEGCRFVGVVDCTAERKREASDQQTLNQKQRGRGGPTNDHHLPQ